MLCYVCRLLNCTNRNPNQRSSFARSSQPQKAKNLIEPQNEVGTFPEQCILAVQSSVVREQKIQKKVQKE